MRQSDFKTNQQLSSDNEKPYVGPELTSHVTMDNSSTSERVYYPLEHHQKEFDELERSNNGGRSQMTDQYNLSRLVDRGALPPPHTISVIIKCTIYGSPKQKLTLKEIRMAMMRRFVYFSESESDGWCNTVRHTLTIESDFVKIRRPKTNDDPGSWWILSSNAEPPDMRPGARASSKSTAKPILRESIPKARSLRPKKDKEEPIWAEMTTSFSSLLSPPNPGPRQSAPGNRPSSSTNAYRQPTSSTNPNPHSTYLGVHQRQSASGYPSSSVSRLPSIRALGLLDLGTAHLSSTQTPRRTEDDSQKRHHYYSQQQLPLYEMARDQRPSQGRDQLRRSNNPCTVSDTETESHYFYRSGR